MRRKGYFLEESVATLFKRAGFNVFLNANKYGFEVDVLAYKKDYHIIVECKQYQDTYLNIGSLIYEWESKCRHAKANKVILVITNEKIKEKHYILGNQLGVYLFNDNKIQYLNSLDNKKLKKKLNELIKFDVKAYWKGRLKKYLTKTFVIVLILLIGYLFLKYKGIV